MFNVKLVFLTSLLFVVRLTLGCNDRVDNVPDDEEISEESMNAPTEGSFYSAEDYLSSILLGPWAEDMDLVAAGGVLSISDDGLPDHELLDAYALFDESNISVVSSPYTYEFPLEPVLADEPVDTNLGTIGVAVSGGIFFNPYEGNGEIALDGNFDIGGIPFIDTCNGHPLPTGSEYHYHGVPYCVTDENDTDGEHSVLVGLLLDGFPLYGPQDIDGDAPVDLDRCNGHEGATPEFPNGVYHYHLSETAPYSIDCYAGVVDEALTSGGMMGPPPGGGEMGPPPGGGA